MDEGMTTTACVPILNDLSYDLHEIVFQRFGFR